MILVSNTGKTWADWPYVQELLLTYLSLLKDVHNKRAVFYALCFKNILEEDINTTASCNIDAFDDYVESYIYIDPNTINAVNMMLTEKEFTSNDFLLESDYNIYKDIITFCNPCEVESKVFMVVKSGTGLTFKQRAKMTKPELQALIPEGLSQMNYRVGDILNPTLKANYKHQVDSLVNSLGVLR